jgi:predicted P-loop ATPase
MPDLGSKDASEALNGYQVIELAELDRILRSLDTTSKEFLTRTYDDFRPPYGRVTKRYARQSIFVGTTNDDDSFLRDATGNRRYWPVQVRGMIDLGRVRDLRDAIWSEALYLALLPTSLTAAPGQEFFDHWLDNEQESDAGSVRQDFVQEDTWTGQITEYCAGKTLVRSVDVLNGAIGKNAPEAIARFTRKDLLRVTDTLRRMGCTPGRDANRVKCWRVPEGLASVTPARTAAQKISPLRISG